MVQSFLIRWNGEMVYTRCGLDYDNGCEGVAPLCTERTIGELHSIIKRRIGLGSEFEITRITSRYPIFNNHHQIIIYRPFTVKTDEDVNRIICYAAKVPEILYLELYVEYNRMTVPRNYISERGEESLLPPTFVDGKDLFRVPASTKFTWKIDNFSESTKRKLQSDIFIAGRCKWYLLIYPNRSYADMLSIYIANPDSMSLPNGWSRDADISLSIINQSNNMTKVKKGTHLFNAKAVFWDTPSPLPIIRNPAAWYIVNDTLTVEAEIQVHSVVHYSVITPEKKVNKDEPKLPKRAVETSVDQVPLNNYSKKLKKCISNAKNIPQKEVLETEATVEPGTAIVTPLTAKPLSQTEGAVQTGATTNEQNIVKESLLPPTIVDEKDVSQDPPSVPVLSSPDAQKISKDLLTEISSRTRTQESLPSSEIPVLSEATRTDFVCQQKEALDGFLNTSLEAIQQAGAFGNIDKIILVLIQHANSLQEKTILEDLASRLAEFQESVPKFTTIAETLQARKTFLAGKTVDLNARLEQRQKELTSLEDKFSRLSEEEAKLHAEIQRLTTQKEELLSQKQSAAIEMQKANERASRELEEWRGLEGEIKQSNAERLEAKEKLALANVRWKHYIEDFAETMKTIKKEEA
ncbi:uncharacterized protein LOC126676405 [Mercurialis annua]|uniref:uncharacterized protein LOC126676405 n=1 Tax=Mercurialis annua TaxID=3986 RepID=UPI0021600DC3|nr:uncharacterized protein LOC126676405 [Mercurialis annua]